MRSSSSLHNNSNHSNSYSYSSKPSMSMSSRMTLLLLGVLVLLLSISTNLLFLHHQIVVVPSQDDAAAAAAVLAEVSTLPLNINDSRQAKQPPNNPKPPCDNFFAVLSNAWIPPSLLEENGTNNSSQSNGTCSETYHKYRFLLQEHDLQMHRMNATMTLFTTWLPQELAEPNCRLEAHYPNPTNLRVQQFDPTHLLQKHGFSDQQLDWMKTWGQAPHVRFNHVATRLSDVFRLALQLEYGMAYADLDVVHLSTWPEIYTSVPNVALPIWSEEKGALEIQNSAFCFSPPQLRHLLGRIQTILDNYGNVQYKRNPFGYTELGPNLFQHAIQSLQALGEVRLYYTHSDDHWKVDDVAQLHTTYGRMVWLHLDRSIRRKHYYKDKQQTFHELVQEFRSACPPPRVQDILPNRPDLIRLEQEQEQQQEKNQTTASGS